MRLPSSVRAAIEAGPIAHIVTLGPDGAPQVTLCWVGLEGDEVVVGTMFDQAKLRNIRRDPRVALSFETGGHSDSGLDPYVVLHGQARITDGGAPELLQRLAYTYVGRDVGVFPPMPDPPTGWVTHIAVERVSGNAPEDTHA
jgi:PPOX class probable F420-dependent enzyme